MNVTTRTTVMMTVKQSENQVRVQKLWRWVFEVVPYSIMSVGHEAVLAVSRHAT